MKALLIDSAARQIRDVEYNNLADMHHLIGGYIEVAYSWPNGDVLFVDEEGLFKPQTNFFRIAARGDTPLAGNGLLVGREVDDDSPRGYHTEPPTMTAQALADIVEFRSRDQVDAWAKANASDAASFITTVGNDGKVVTTVTGHIGELYASMPRPAPEGE
jgi:hypothetical protein